MERPTQKAINFDLDTNIMKQMNLYPDGYRQLGKSFHKYGFEHRQGSGYVSREKIVTADVTEVVYNVVKENPWLGDCVKKCDVSNIGKQFDLIPMINFAEAQNGKTTTTNSMTSAWEEYMNTPMPEKSAPSSEKAAQKNKSNYME